METRCPLAKQNVKFKKLNKKKGRGNQEEHEKQVIYMKDEYDNLPIALS
jgi:hypothetical protein